MKKILLFCAVTLFWFSAFCEHPPLPSVTERMNNAEIIAFISVTNVTTNIYTDAEGRRVSYLEADATTDQEFKGAPPKSFRIRQEMAEEASWTQLRSEVYYLAFLKHSGDFYLPTDFYGLGGVVVGRGLHPENRVLWPYCTSVAEAIVWIKKELNTVGELHIWPYQTKPKTWDATDKLFFWWISPDRKRIGYEPCSGSYLMDLIREDEEELIFEITGSSGQPLDLMTGQYLDKTDVFGKQFRAKVKGDQILEVSVLLPTASDQTTSALKDRGIPSFVNVMITGSPEARAQAQSKAWESVEDREASEEAKKIGAEIRLFWWKVERGETSPQEFEAYCRAVKVLIGDFMKVWDPKNPTLNNALYSLLYLAGDPYHNLEAWTPVENLRKARQKWITSEIGSDATFLEIINNGSTEARKQAAVKLHHFFQTTLSEPWGDDEATRFAVGAAQLGARIIRGESSPQEFESFSIAVEILIADYIAAKDAEDKDVADPVLFAIRVISNNPLTDFAYWNRIKDSIKKRQH